MLILNLFDRQLVQQCMVFPNTSLLNKVEKTPILNEMVDDLKEPSSLDQVIKEVKEDVNLMIFGVNRELSSLLSIFAKYHSEFILKNMDSIVISTMRNEMLIVRYENRSKYDRSLFMELTLFVTGSDTSFQSFTNWGNLIVICQTCIRFSISLLGC